MNLESQLKQRPFSRRAAISNSVNHLIGRGFVLWTGWVTTRAGGIIIVGGHRNRGRWMPEHDAVNLSSTSFARPTASWRLCGFIMYSLHWISFLRLERKQFIKLSECNLVTLVNKQSKSWRNASTVVVCFSLKMEALLFRYDEVQSAIRAFKQNRPNVPVDQLNEVTKTIDVPIQPCRKPRWWLVNHPESSWTLSNEKFETATR